MAESTPKVTVSLERKINIGNYENVVIFMSVSNLDVGATPAEIEEALVTGETAFQLLRKKMTKKLRQVRAEDTNE